ncbi:MAG: SLC13 family permease, partial [Candidatus Thermoplasmatota archaeon]|nr:SLC13 family permease [Candidatus Thermoplasmatota archaeon]
MGTKILFNNRHPAQIIAFVLLICVALVILLQNTQAGGGSSDIHLELNIKEGLSNQAVFVGLGILLFVYALIITEVVHRTLAAALGGLMAIVALNYYTEESALSLKAVTTMIDWETIGLLLGMMIMVGIISHTGVFE